MHTIVEYNCKRVPYLKTLKTLTPMGVTISLNYVTFKVDEIELQEARCI